MQALVITLGLVLIAAGLVFVVRGLGHEPGRGGFRGLIAEGPAWLLLIVIGCGLVVFGATKDWSGRRNTATATSSAASADSEVPETEPSEEPGTIEEPEESEVPEQPADPEEPDEPEGSDEPGEPDQPGQSETPEEPDDPDEPETPGEPEEPGTPEEPEEPDTPEEPEEPEVPPAGLSEILHDCLSYQASSLTIVDEGASGWLLTDGRSRMVVLDNQTDAEAALAVASRHTHHCFIGRSNMRADRRGYIVEFWIGASGLDTDPLDKDCIRYDPASLQIRDEGASGWLLTDGGSRMVVLDDEADASAALAAAAQFSAQCFIGRDNERIERSRYIMAYWE